MTLPLAAFTLALAIAAPASAMDRRTDHPVLPAALRPPSAPAARIAATSACQALPGWECGSIDVPIDRTDPALGTTEVSYAVRPHDDQSRPAEGTTLVADGPGSPTVTDFGGFFFPFSALGDLTTTHDFVLVDIRGTGAAPLDCPDYQHGVGPFTESIASCAAQLGSARDFYTYGDGADDMDDVRAALGIDKVDVYATGHATPLAEAYAVRHHAHVRSLVLDSPADFPTWPDDAFRDALHVSGRICRRSPLCSAQIRDPEGDVAWLARRLRRRPLTGTGYDADGAPHQVRLGEAELAYRLLFDKSGPQRTLAELPAAARALRAGDPVPLLRLAAENDYPLPGAPNDQGDPTEWSAASYNAAFCPQWPLGWDISGTRERRLTQFRAARAALPRDFFAPFSIDAALTPFPDEQCLSWPAPARTNPILPPGARYPDIPVLTVHGDLNTDATVTGGARVAARFPNGRFVAIAQAAQSAAGWSTCAQRIIQSFVTSLDPGDTRCAADEQQPFPGVGEFPQHVRDYAPAQVARSARTDRSRRSDRRVAAVAVQTYLDAVYTQLFRAQGTTGRGLRGGSYGVEFGDTGATFTLDHARLVEDVAVTGTGVFNFDGPAPNSGELRVAGKGTAPGTIKLVGDPVFDNTVPKIHVNGRIGHRRLNLLVPIH
jgi:pimeloyl-ACP methyl ester carboxylesterase